MTFALPPSILHWALVGRSDGTRAQFIVSHRTSEFAGTALAVTMAHYKVDGFAVCLAVKTHDKDTVIVDPPLA